MKLTKTLVVETKFNISKKISYVTHRQGKSVLCRDIVTSINFEESTGNGFTSIPLLCITINLINDTLHLYFKLKGTEYVFKELDSVNTKRYVTLVNSRKTHDWVKDNVKVYWE